MSDQDFSRSLPDRPNLEQLKKQAKSLLKDLRAGDTTTLAFVAHHEQQLDADAFSLQDAQRVLARAHGFSSWTRLKERVAIVAIKNGDAANLQGVLRSTSDVKKMLTTKIAGQPTNHAIGKDATLLQLASVRPWKGEDLSSMLVELGAEVDLHSACGLGNTQRIDEILSADPKAFDTQIDTYFPLQYAITAPRLESIRTLMKHGDDANRDLKKVAYFGWEDDAIDQDYTPWKPIHLVAMPNRVDMIRFYVKSGVDVDSRSVECDVIRLGSEEAGPCGSAFGNTPLMIACGEGFQEATDCLLELGADVNARNDQGQTALHFAAKRFWNGQPYDKVIESLLARGADKDARDDDGNVPTV